VPAIHEPQCNTCWLEQGIFAKLIDTHLATHHPKECNDRGPRHVCAFHTQASDHQATPLETLRGGINFGTGGILSKQDQRRGCHLWATIAYTSGTEKATRIWNTHYFEL